MLAAIDIHKAIFQAAVLDPDSGEITEERFQASRKALAVWIAKWQGQITVVAVEATTGWRWVARELQARCIEVRLTDPGQASTLQGNRKRAKTDRLDARWLVLLLARELLPDAWLPPEDIQRLRDQTRLRKALTDDHTRWAQRLHALLVHEGWPCARGSLLTGKGRRWVAAIRLQPTARAQIDTMLAVMATLSHEIDLIDCALRRHAKTDPRLRALQQIYGIGPILACTILAEIGDAPPWPPRQAGSTQSALGARRGRPTRPPPDQPRPRALPPPPRPRRRQPRHPRHRSQDRQARLPRPARPRGHQRLTTPALPRGNAHRTR